MAYQGTAYSYNQRTEITIANRTGSTASCLLPTRTGTSYYGVSNNFKPFVANIGLDTDIEFYVVSDDRRAVNLTNKTFTAYVVSRSDNVIRVKKTLTVLNYNFAILLLRLTKSDLAGLEEGLYDLTITYTDSENNEFGLIAVQGSNSITYTLELTAASGLQIQASSIETAFNGANNTSANFPSTAQTYNSDGTNTAVAYTTGFSGKLYAEGTLVSSPSERDWFEIKLDPENDNNYWTFTSSTGLEAFTWDGMFQWVRFRYVADVGNTGTLDKILYRA